MELHAYVAAVDGVVVALVAAEVQVVSVVAFVWQTDDYDLGWKSHLRHRTIQNLCRMEKVMGTAVKELLALELLFETLVLIHLMPTIVTVVISQADAARTGMKRRKMLLSTIFFFEMKLVS